MAAKDYLRLMRPHQWYKNLLIFLAIIFVEIPNEWPWERLPAILNLNNYPPLIFGFAVFCAVSSAGYIINDIADMEEDAAHPEKMNRPLPSGRVSASTARILAVVLLVSGLISAYILVNGVFFLLVIFYLINAQLYNFILRKIAIIDVIDIAVGFIIRAVAGTVAIGVPFTSWLVVGGALLLYPQMRYLLTVPQPNLAETAGWVKVENSGDTILNCGQQNFCL